MAFKNVLLTKKGRVYPVKDIKSDFHCKDGFIRSKELQLGKNLKTNLGVEMSIFSPFFIDLYKKLKRTAQIMTLKDIGTVIAETGINKKSKVVDAGTGSGALSLFLAGVAKEVVSYEIREEFIKNAEKNKKMLGLKNIKFKHGDVSKNIDETEVDVVIFDLLEPWAALKSASKALKKGGFLVVYLPHISQTMQVIKEMEQQGFVYLKTIENIQRDWVIDELKSRPANTIIGHTGFLTFARKF